MQYSWKLQKMQKFSAANFPCLWYVYVYIIMYQSQDILGMKQYYNVSLYSNIYYCYKYTVTDVWLLS